MNTHAQPELPKNNTDLSTTPSVAPSSVQKRGNSYADDPRFEDITDQVLGGGIIICGVGPSAEDSCSREIGNAQRLIQQAAEAERFSEYDAAAAHRAGVVEIFRKLRENTACEVRQKLANALTAQANTFSRLRRVEEAIACYDEAIAIETELRAEDGDKDLPESHAATLLNKGLALCNAGRSSEGRALYEIALAVFRRLSDAESASATWHVGLILFNDAEALSGLGEFAEAVNRYDEAIAIYERLVKQHGSNKHRVDVAVAFTKKCKALLRLERFEDALNSAERAVAILESLAQESGYEDRKLDLSLALRWRGKALDRLYRQFDASESYRRSTELVEQVHQLRGTTKPTENVDSD